MLDSAANAVTRTRGAPERARSHVTPSPEAVVTDSEAPGACGGAEGPKPRCPLVHAQVIVCAAGRKSNWTSRVGRAMIEP